MVVHVNIAPARARFRQYPMLRLAAMRISVIFTNWSIHAAHARCTNQNQNQVEVRRAVGVGRTKGDGTGPLWPLEFPLGLSGA